MAKGITARVVKVLDREGYKVVLNKGSIDGIKQDMEFMLYEVTEELFDPETDESLGVLEVSKGKGIIIEVQEKMSILYSSNYDSSSVDPYGAISFSSLMANAMKKKIVPFSHPLVKDYAKLIKDVESEGTENSDT